MEMTLNIPEELAPRIRSLGPELPFVLELGLSEQSARRQSKFSGLSGVLEALALLPSPEEVMAFRPSPELETRIGELIAKKKEGAMSAEEEQEWERYAYVEHLVRIAKGQARKRLAGAAGQ